MDETLMVDHGDRRPRHPADRADLAGHAAPLERQDRPHRSRHARCLSPRRKSGGARGPTTSERRASASRRALVRCERLAAAPAPARNAGAGAARAKRAAGCGDRRRQDAGRVPADDLRAGASSPIEGLHTLYVSPLKALAVDVQRNLIGPIEEMGLSDPGRDPHRRHALRPQGAAASEAAAGAADHARIAQPAAELPRSAQMFEGLRTIVVDELHGFAKEKRGDLLSLSMSRLQKLAPGLRRVGLSATISDPDAYRSWLAPDADMELVDLVIGDPGAEPDLSILIPENRIPWGGHSGRHAAREVMKLIEEHKTTLVFCNTRSLAELIFQDLWAVNDKALPIGIHHGSLRSRRGARSKARWPRASCAGWSPPPASISASTGATSTSSSRWARRRAARACCSGSAAPITGSTSPARASSFPATASNISRRAPRWTRSTTASSIPRSSAPARSTCSPSTSWRWRSPRRSSRRSCSPKSALPRPYAGLKAETFEEILNFIATGGYALKAYDRFRRLVPEPGGMWRIARPAIAQQHRLNAGVIVEQPLLTVRFRNGRKLGTIEEGYASTLAPRRSFLLLRPQPRGRAVQGHRHHRPRVLEDGADRHLRRPAHVDVDPPRQPRPPHAVRPQRLVRAFPTTSANGWRCSRSARSFPSRTSCWSRPSRTKGSTSWSPTASRAGTRTSRSAC